MGCTLKQISDKTNLIKKMIHLFETTMHLNMKMYKRTCMLQYRRPGFMETTGLCSHVKLHQVNHPVDFTCGCEGLK